MNEMLNEINKIIQENENVRGTHVIYHDTPFNEAMDIINKVWKFLDENNKQKISEMLLDKPNYLIGNEKWVLYNYICQVPNPVGILAGNYAYYKIKNMLTDISDMENNINYQSCRGIINGENIYLVNNNEGQYKLQRNEVKIVNKMKKGKVITLYFK